MIPSPLVGKQDSTQHKTRTVCRFANTFVERCRPGVMNIENIPRSRLGAKHRTQKQHARNPGDAAEPEWPLLLIHPTRSGDCLCTVVGPECHVGACLCFSGVGGSCCVCKTPSAPSIGQQAGSPSLGSRSKQFALVRKLRF